ASFIRCRWARRRRRPASYLPRARRSSRSATRWAGCRSSRPPPERGAPSPRSPPTAKSWITDRRTLPLPRAFVTVVTLVPLGACWSDDRPIQWERPRTVLGPIPLKTQVAYVDSALDRVVLIDVAGDAPVIAHTKIGRRALYAVP